MRRPDRRLPPALMLFCLSPIVAELLSGSAPPSEFFSPFSLVLLLALYGSGAVWCRETVRGWGRGWLSLLTLGAAYGILEEGLMVKSFFDPEWMDLGPLAAYGRWGGVNWVWAGALTVYHAVFSIAIPVVIAELAYPDRRDQPWVSRRMLRLLPGLLVAVTVFGYLFLTPYRPPAIPYLICALSVVALVWLARRVADPLPSALTRPLPKPRSWWLLGLLGTLAHFFFAWIVPWTPIPPFGALLGMCAVAGVVAAVVLRAVIRGGGLGGSQRLALVAGGLTFLMVLAPLQELDTSRADDTTGMTLVGLSVLVGLLWLGRKVRTGPSARGEPACSSVKGAVGS